MRGFIDIAQSILVRTEQQLETVSNNVANAQTPGFKRQISFSEILTQAASGAGQTQSTTQDMFINVFAEGKLTNTGNPTDMAISGSGFFWVEKDDVQLLTRDGAFNISSNGELVTRSGHNVLNLSLIHI